MTLILPHLIFLCVAFHRSLAGLLPEPLKGQPLNPDSTVPAFPVQAQTQTCRLELSDELFGGVNEACGRGQDRDRSRCCPVLAAWLFSAHARSALEVSSPAPTSDGDVPMIPEDSEKCVNSLQSSLISRNIQIPQPNASCDPISCFCGIRLHHISSLTCPAAFNVTASHNPKATAAVLNLEKNCQNSSYYGCTKCLGALREINVTGSKSNTTVDRASKMFNMNCQLMGLTWLLARNKTTYIPTVSAVLRAIMYGAHPPQESKCSSDQENMPLAVDSLEVEKADSSSLPSVLLFPILPLIICLSFMM